MKNSLSCFLESKQDGAFFVGHSSAIVKLGSDLFLFDGIWGNANPYENFLFYPKQFDCSQILPLLTCATVSHEHFDHWYGPILKNLPCTVTIMNGRPRLEKRLGEFAKVNSLPRFKWEPIGKSADILFIPNPRNDVDSSCLIRGNGMTVYLSSDNFLDRNLCQVVANLAGKIDIAFLCYSFVHYYPALIEMNLSKKREEGIRLKKQSLDQARMFVEIANPKMVVPFGNNLFFCEGLTHPLNEFLAKPTELYRATPLNAGDYLLKDNGQISSYCHAVHDSPEWKSLPEMNFQVELSDKDLTSIIGRVRQAAKTAPGHAITVNGVVTIDAQERRTYDGISTSILRDRKRTEFYFDAPIFKKWASGKITFEQALGSRRFRYSRTPDEFDKTAEIFWATFL